MTFKKQRIVENLRCLLQLSKTGDRIMNTKTNEPEFSKLRRIFFPIHSYELKKAIPMGMIFFFILFNYTCLRNIKDSLIVTQNNFK